MGFRKIISRFRGDERGAIVIWVGLSMPMILGIGALAFDMNSMYVTKAQLQYTADAAATAAARALPDQAAATTAAQNYASINMPSTPHGTVVKPEDVTPGNWDAGTRTFTPGANPVNAVQVSAHRDEQNGNPISTLIASTLGVSSVDISASSIAAFDPGAVAGTCILALNMTAPAAFHLNGTAKVKTSSCNVQVNSCNMTDAILASGLTLVEIEADTGEIMVCGMVKKNGPALFNPTPYSESTEYYVADPYDVMTYSFAGCDHTTPQSIVGTGGTVNVDPGIYCAGLSITGTGTAIFDGNYTIKGGELFVAGTMAVESGPGGVTFFVSGADANVNFAGTADIGLAAPTDPGNDYKGFVFFGDKLFPATNPHIMRGTAILGGYDGHIYLPGAKVLMVGTAIGLIGSSDCTVFVADTFEFAGTPELATANACASYGGSFASGVASIVN